MSKYYNHDHIWAKRSDGNPVWGSYSVILYKRILDILKANGVTSGRLIDFGCGAGKFGELAEAAGFKYIGLDDSNEAITLGKRAWPQMDLRTCDLASKSLTDDLIQCAETGTAINSLHCLTETDHRKTFVTNMAAAIKPGGVLFLSTMVGPLTRKHRPSDSPRSYLEPEQVIHELTDVGFTKIHFRSDIAADKFNAIPNLEILIERGD